MQKVSSKLPSWETTKTKSKQGFDKVSDWADRNVGAPVNRLSNRMGSEAFWPTTLDKESEKAARILRSFCKDGFYTEVESEATAQVGPKSKQRVLKKIPAEVIQRAVGLAIFTTMRTGLWVSGAGGSGVLVARSETDGSWSPPSGIMLHTAGLGFLVGVDIYDCVLVINNRRALQSFTRIRATLGGEISAVAGPVGAGGVVENDGKWKQMNRPVFTYLKSRGFYAGVQVDGTIIIERTDENRRFYGQDVRATDILAGRVRHPPPELRMLMETLKAAEGRADVDAALLDTLADQPDPDAVDLDAPPSADATATTSGAPVFGVPDPDDPDPYGVLALEKAGLEVRDAATRSRPSSQSFSFNPSPTSPVYTTFHSRHNRSISRLSRPWPALNVAHAETQTDPVIVVPLPPVAPPSASSAPASDASDAESIYEDVADAPSVGNVDIDVDADSDADVDARARARARAHANGDSNPWSTEPGSGIDSASYSPYARDRDLAATRVVVLPTGPPPPLPPRAPAAKADVFEEISLNGAPEMAPVDREMPAENKTTADGSVSSDADEPRTTNATNATNGTHDEADDAAERGKDTDETEEHQDEHYETSDEKQTGDQDEAETNSHEHDGAAVATAAAETTAAQRPSVDGMADEKDEKEKDEMDEKEKEKDEKAGGTASTADAAAPDSTTEEDAAEALATSETVAPAQDAGQHDSQLTDATKTDDAGSDNHASAGAVANDKPGEDAGVKTEP